ncbi:MAG TPA: glutaredoxin 3 [Hyphomicrobiaceae bacterium]|nr:glutaredoxin 3 [Hyphomicrobiaceae bacterium]
MPTIVVYSTMLCPYCFMAKKLLNQKGVAFEEIDVGRNPQFRREMQEKSGGRHTVPQIFFGDRHIGGCDDLYDLDRAGQLDPLLAT